MKPGELAKFSLLAGLREPELEALAAELEAVELAGETPLFRAGDRADGALFVARGGVRVGVEGGPSAEFGPGEVLGTLSLVVDGPRETSAETSSRTTLWQLSRSGYRRLAASEPAVACHLLENILRDYAAEVRAEVRRRPGGAPPVDRVNPSD